MTPATPIMATTIEVSTSMIERPFLGWLFVIVFMAGIRMRRSVTEQHSENLWQFRERTQFERQEKHWDL